MDANDFFKDFKKKAEKDISLECYRGEYEVFTDKITDVIAEVLKNNGYSINREYFKIDVTAWHSIEKNSDLQKTSKFKNHALWSLDVAVEHENDNEDWNYEFIKLAQINCPLKVVISYTPCGQREYTNPEHLEHKRLKYAADCLQKLTKARGTEDKSEYMVILGNCYDSKQTYTTFDYRGYIYKDGEFKQI